MGVDDDNSGGDGEGNGNGNGAGESAGTWVEQDRPLVDADERMLSMEELKQEMFRSLRDTGTVEVIRAQLRRRFIEKLQRHAHRVRYEAGGADADTHGVLVIGNEKDREGSSSRCEWSVQQKMVHGLIVEYLERYALEHTIAVFIPEVGGQDQHIALDTVRQLLKLPFVLASEDALAAKPIEEPLLLVVLSELQRRVCVATTSVATQTIVDCLDHRLQLENQLRRVETTYLAQIGRTDGETSSVKKNGESSMEIRMLSYQRECDAMSEQRLQQDLARFQATELAFVRVEERKRLECELDEVKTTLLAEHRDRLQRLQDRERELEMVFAARKTELETSLFDARQNLFLQQEELRKQLAEVEQQRNADARQLSSETTRMQLWKDQLEAREKNLEETVQGLIREREREWQLDQYAKKREFDLREDALKLREQEVSSEEELLRRKEQERKALLEERRRLSEQLQRVQNALDSAHETRAHLEREKKILEAKLVVCAENINEQKLAHVAITQENERLLAERNSIRREIERLENLGSERDEDRKLLVAQIHELQTEVITLQRADAKAVGDARRGLLREMEQERVAFRMKENELLHRLRDAQTRLSECEARADKYEMQFEDEKVHVEGLRHDVASLNTLLAQARTAITSRHGGAGIGTGLTGAGILSSAAPISNDPAMMMRMMEMMGQMMRNHGGDSHSGSFANYTPAAVSAGSTLGSCPVKTPTQKEVYLNQKVTERLMQQHLSEEGKVNNLNDQVETEGRRDADSKADQETERLRLLEVEDEDRKKQYEERRKRQAQELEEDQERMREAHKRRVQLQRELEEAEEFEAAQRRQKRKEQDDEEDRERVRARAETAERERVQERERSELREKEHEWQNARERERERELEHERETERIREMKWETERVQEKEYLAVQKHQMLLESDHGREGERQLQEQQEVDAAAEQKVCGHEQVHIENESQSRNTEELTGSIDVRGIEESVNDSCSVEQPQIVCESLVDQGDRRHDQRNTEQQAGDEIAITSPAEHHDEDEMTVVGSPMLTESGVNEEIKVQSSPEESPKTRIPVSSLLPSPTIAEDVVKTKTPEEMEEERRQAEAEAKRQADEAEIDVYRQRVLARKAAEKQRQVEKEEEERREKEREQERQREDTTNAAGAEAETSDDNELELSGGSFAESSAASGSDSF